MKRTIRKYLIWKNIRSDSCFSLRLQKNKSPPRSVVLHEIRTQCIQFTIMLLLNSIQLELNEIRTLSVCAQKNNPLLRIMLTTHSLPHGFVAELIQNVQQDQQLFSDVRSCTYKITNFCYGIIVTILFSGILTGFTRIASNNANFVDKVR